MPGTKRGREPFSTPLFYHRSEINLTKEGVNVMIGKAAIVIL